MSADASIAFLARRQLGLVTLRQAIDAGLTTSAIRVRVAKGVWSKIRRTVYVVAGVRPTHEQALLAVCLAAGEACWVSHRSAASLWGLAIPRPDVIDVTTSAGKRLELTGVRQHRSSTLPRADVVRHRLVPVTSVARTIIDCAPFLPGDRLVDAVDDADRRGLLEIGNLSVCVKRLDHGGRRLLVPLREVLADRLEGRQAGGSRREIDVLNVLRAAGLPLPVQQHVVVVGGRRRVLDYAYLEEMVALEFEGFNPHATVRSVFDDGAIRRNDLEVSGWLVLQITSKTSPLHLVERTRQALALRQRCPA